MDGLKGIVILLDMGNKTRKWSVKTTGNMGVKDKKNENLRIIPRFPGKESRNWS